MKYSYEQPTHSYKDLGIFGYCDSIVFYLYHPCRLNT